MTVSIRDWAFPLILTLTCFGIACAGDAGRGALRYLGPGAGFSPGDISHRWLTGHFAHIGWRHVGLNIAGLLSVWAVYGRVFSARSWLVFFLICPLGISLGLSLLSPQTAYYVGLSGVLHGMLAAAVTAALLAPSNGPKWEEIVVLAGLWIKIIYEQTIGAVPMTAAIAGDAVVIGAHLYGALIGTGFALAHRTWKIINCKVFTQINEPPIDSGSN